MTGIHTRRRTPLAMLAGGAVSFLIAGAMAAAPAFAGNGHGNGPPGSNGTIKINDVELGPGHANDPHISCPFLVTFWGFDTGTNNASVAFTAQPPSGKFTPIPLKAPSDAATFTFTGHGAGNALDASKSYSLDTSGLVKQPQQGYHVKVVVTVTSQQSSATASSAPGNGKGNGKSSNGNNGKATGQSATQKSKVFWTECAPAKPASPTPTPSVTPSSAPPSPVVSPTQAQTAPAPAPSQSVIGEKVTAPTAAKQLPFTGAPTGLLVSTALGFILTGCGLLGMTRRPRIRGSHR